MRATRVKIRIDVEGTPVTATLADAETARDDAYRAKYRGSPYLSPMIGPRARAATVGITPREGKRP